MHQPQFLQPWNTLSEREKSDLQMAYQSMLDTQAPTCDLDVKISRFAEWLEEHGVSFSKDDLRRPAAKK